MRRAVNVGIGVLCAAVLLALAFPFAMRVQHAAHVTACKNNLRQIGIAVGNYRDCNLSLPPGCVPNSHLPPEKRLSWLAGIMPYIEGGAPRLDHDKSWDAAENRRVRMAKTEGYTDLSGYRVFYCPTETDRCGPPAPALTTYIGLAGVGGDAATLPKDHRRAGIFGYDRTIKADDIKDGLATTLMVLETATDNGPWTQGGHTTVRPLDPGNPLLYLGRDGQFSSRHTRSTGFFHTAFVTNALYADGSVRSLRPAKNDKILEALATIAGGEDVDILGDP